MSNVIDKINQKQINPNIPEFLVLLSTYIFSNDHNYH